LQAGAVAAAHLVGEVVADLRAEPSLGGLEPDVDPRQLEQRGAQARRRVVEVDQGAERVEQDRPRARHQATHCQVANWVTNRPSTTAEAIATRSVIRRSSQTRPSHMKIGKSTATKRGSDISGCAATG